MRHYMISIILLMISGMGFMACDDFLSQEPGTTWDSDNFYKNKQEAELGLMGIYNYIAHDHTYGGNLSSMFMAGTDEGHYSRHYNENWPVSLYTHTAASVDIERTWYALYQGIDAANKFIEQVPHTAGMDSALRLSMLGEARFLRAQFYFDLVRWFGPVPLRLKATKDIDDNYCKPALVADVYVKIIEDLNFAVKHLETPEVIASRKQNGRAHHTSAHGLLARVYLTMAGEPLKDTEKYDKVIEHCDSVLNYGYHEMNADYETTFRNYIGNVMDSKATLFEASFANLRDQGITEHGRIGNLNGVQFTYGGGGYPYAYAFIQLSISLKDAFEYGDARYRWNCADYSFKFDKETQTQDIKRITSEFGWWPGKFRRWEPANYADLDSANGNEQYLVLEPLASPDKNFTGINFPILRMADIWLMRAEAENELYGATPKAFECINEVRHRAGLGDLDNSRITNQAEFRKELQDERFRELCFEGIRHHDLVRWGILKETLDELKETITTADEYAPGKAWRFRSCDNFDESRHLTLPYPLQEVTINDGLEQKAAWR